jgi:biopolymer transport protein ExbD
MRLVRSKRMQAIIPTASMADIAFLLIIFFMVTTVHEVDRTKVDLPFSSSSWETEKASPFVVVHKNPDTGALVYKFSAGDKNSYDVGGPNDFYLEASRVTNQIPDAQFVIKADYDLRFAVIDEVMDQLRKGGAQRLLLLSRPGRGEDRQ